MAAFICPKKEDCDRIRDIVFKLRDNTNMRSEEVPCNPPPTPRCPAALPTPWEPPPPSQHSCDDDYEPPCQFFKKRDIVNMISEEVPCSKAPRRRALVNPCNHTCPENTPATSSSPQEETKATQAMDVMICFKVKKDTKASSDDKKTKKGDSEEASVKPSKSRELRAGIIYIGCDCEKRNGLQDDCRRTGCHGSPECLAKPKPICGPSEFSNGKHLGKKGHNKRGGQTETSATGKGGGDVFGDYQCMPAVVQKACCEKC